MQPKSQSAGSKTRRIKHSRGFKARWKARIWGQEEDAPEEFGVEPQNTRALEFMARIRWKKARKKRRRKSSSAF